MSILRSTNKILIYLLTLLALKLKFNKKPIRHCPNNNFNLKFFWEVGLL